MVKFVNAITGGDMWVADNRIEEYKAAGHKLAADNLVTEKPAEKPKTAAKKTTTKRGK